MYLRTYVGIYIFKIKEFFKNLQLSLKLQTFICLFSVFVEYGRSVLTQITRELGSDRHSSSNKFCKLFSLFLGQESRREGKRLSTLGVCMCSILGLQMSYCLLEVEREGATI